MKNHIFGEPYSDHLECKTKFFPKSAQTLLEIGNSQILSENLENSIVLIILGNIRFRYIKILEYMHLIRLHFIKGKN